MKSIIIECIYIYEINNNRMYIKLIYNIVVFNKYFICISLYLVSDLVYYPWPTMEYET